MKGSKYKLEKDAKTKYLKRCRADVSTAGSWLVVGAAVTFIASSKLANNTILKNPMHISRIQDYTLISIAITLSLHDAKAVDNL
jgi:hypothetical protein